MSNNFHGIGVDPNAEATEQDTMKAKLDLITIASARNIDDMQVLINTNTAVRTTNTEKLDMTTTSTLRTYAEASRALITTNTTNINGFETGLFGDMNYFIMNSPTYFDMTGSGFTGAITGSVLSSFELTSDPKRFVIGSLGIAQDTESPNNFSFTESDTLIQFGWSANTVLVFYKMEMYDNSSGNRTLEFGMYDDHHNTNKFSIRHDVYMDSSSFRFKQVSGFAGSIAIQNYAKYYFWAKSNGGGKLQGVQFFLVRSNKNF